MGSTTEKTTVDTSAVVTEMTTIDETTLPKGAPTTAIANAFAGTSKITPRIKKCVGTFLGKISGSE